MSDRAWMFLAKGAASVAACAMGGYLMKITNGSTGIGWAVFGLFIIWNRL